MSAEILASPATSQQRPAAPATPVSHKAAATILGSMILLIAALTLQLVQTTFGGDARPEVVAEQIVGR